MATGRRYRSTVRGGERVRDHDRQITAHLRAAYTRDGTVSRAAAIVEALLVASPTFAAIWREHPVSGPNCGPKRVQHSKLGTLELHCQNLVDPDQSQTLLVFTAVPGSESYEKLQLLPTFADQRI
jgi:MmyB-like transcription regulator ligand binding domain